MDWMVPKNRLDKEQITILNTIYDGVGCFFVRGCPGTGKSVLLAHLYHEFVAAHPGQKVCILTYTHALIDCIKDGLRDSELRIYTFPMFAYAHARSHWDLILVDEAQDLQPVWADAIARTGARVVFFGDFKQSIYGETLTEELFLRKFNPAIFELRTIYRLTRNTNELIGRLFPQNLLQAKIGPLVANTEIQLVKTDSLKDDYSFMATKIVRYAFPQKPAAVLFRKRASLHKFLRVAVPDLPLDFQLNDTVNAQLRVRGSVFRFIGNGYGDFLESDSRPIVYVMTWHSAKGLDFNTVALPAISSSRMDEGPLYVALTRGRLNLFVSYVKEDEGGIISKMASCPVVKNMTSHDESNPNVDAEETTPLF